MGALQTDARVMSRPALAFLVLAALAAAIAQARAGTRSQRPVPVPSPVPVVVALHELTASRAARILRGFYPSMEVRVDARANAVIVLAPADEADAVRTILQGIDVRNPSDDSVDAQTLHNVSPQAVLRQLRSVFPTDHFFVAPNRTLITVASPDDLQQIRTIVAAIDTPPVTPSPRPRYAPDALRVTQGNVRTIARAVAHQVPDVAVAISGSDIVVRGPPDEVQHAKALIAQLDVPQRGAIYATVYRLRYADAASVASVLGQSFPDAHVQTNADLNAVTVTAQTSLQDRIALAVAQLDAAPAGAPGAAAGERGSIQVVTLNAAIPGASGPPTTATDIAQTVQQALQQTAPDLHITVPQGGTQLILTGSPYSIELAKNLIAQLDVIPPMVVLDTEILEVDEGVAKQLGFEFPSAMLSTTYSETTPQAGLSGIAARLLGLQPLTRTPLSLVAELNFLVSTNKARILEDPRITTFSGHTAS
ncbi:MAG: secretin N-terminal domain-containing protein, partial [Candidatus Tyrphobacter sp.]